MRRITLCVCLRGCVFLRVCALLSRAVPELGCKQGYVMQFAVTPLCKTAREISVFVSFLFFFPPNPSSSFVYTAIIKEESAFLFKTHDYVSDI